MTRSSLPHSTTATPAVHPHIVPVPMILEIIIRAFRITEAKEDRGEIVVHNPRADAREPPKSFFFDAVFGDRSAQERVYEVCGAPLVESVLQGYNGTIFAYGQARRCLLCVLFLRPLWFMRTVFAEIRGLGVVPCSNVDICSGPILVAAACSTRACLLRDSFSPPKARARAMAMQERKATDR